MNPRTNAGSKPGIDFTKLHACFGERDALHPAHCGISSEKKFQLRFEWNFKRVLAERALPAIDVGVLGRHHYITAFCESRSLRDRNGLRGASRGAVASEPIRRRKSPCTVHQNANAQTNGFGLRQGADLAIFRGEIA